MDTSGVHWWPNTMETGVGLWPSFHPLIWLLPLENDFLPRFKRMFDSELTTATGCPSKWDTMHNNNNKKALFHFVNKLHIIPCGHVFISSFSHFDVGLLISIFWEKNKKYPHRLLNKLVSAAWTATTEIWYEAQFVHKASVWWERQTLSQSEHEADSCR